MHLIGHRLSPSVGFMENVSVTADQDSEVLSEDLILMNMLINILQDI